MRKFKKSLSVFLAALMAFGVFAVAAFAGTLTPVVYIHGDKPFYYTDENGNKTEIFDDGEYLSEFVSKALPLIPKALVSGNWDEYSEAALDVFLPAFEHFAPNPDGTLPEGSAIDWSWNPLTLAPDEYWSGGRKVYEYQPDSRLSPLDIADEIDLFVNTVLEKTGSEKVVIVSRCEGCSLAMAYLYEYAMPDNFSKIENIVFLNGTMNGSGHVDAILTGNVVLPPEAVYRFGQYLEMNNRVKDTIDAGTIDEQMLGYVYMILEMLKETYGLNITADLVENLYKNLKDSFLAKLLKAWWGICLSYVACVNENYDDYVSYIFAEEGDREKYANIIAKADEFHNTVQANTEAIIASAKAAGVGVNAISEYGGQVYPISAESELIGDTFLTVKRQSFGATTSNTVGTLSEDYIKSRTDAGYGDYISPDRQIDASTSLLPENTWYIKNMVHEFPGVVNELIADIISSPDNTVRTTRYTQFLNYNPIYGSNGILSAAQEVNENDFVWETEYTGKGTRSFIQIIVDFIKGLVEKVREFIMRFTRIKENF